MVCWRRCARLMVALAALLGALAGCGLPGQPQSADLASDQTLKMIWSLGVSGTMFALDPAQVDNTGSAQFTSLLYDSLVTLDRNEQVEPWGASAWKVSPDGLTYTFTLRPNQHFSDGAPVTASDYAWSIDRAAHVCGAGLRTFFDLTAIKGAAQLTASDCDDPSSRASLVGNSIFADNSARTLTIELAQPAGYFLAALATSASMALERTVIETQVVNDPSLGTTPSLLVALTKGATGQGGSGMFYLADAVVSAENNPGSLTLKPNPHWWGIAAGKTPHFSEITVSLPRPTLSSDSTFRQFQSDLSTAFLSALPTDQPLTPYLRQPYYHEQQTLYGGGLLFVWRNPPFDDLNARKAFCLAINREQFNQQMLHGQMLPTWHIVPEGMPGYNATLTGPDGASVADNTALARHYWQLYLASHHNQAPPIANDYNQPFALSYGYTSLSSYRQEAAWLADTWKKTFDITTFLDLSEWGHGPGWESSRQIWGYGQGWPIGYVDPQALLAGYQTADMDVPQADALLQRADALSDMSQRIPLYNEAEQLLIDNVVYCPLYQIVRHYALRPWVKGGFVEDARGVFPNDTWVSGYIAKH